MFKRSSINLSMIFFYAYFRVNQFLNKMAKALKLYFDKETIDKWASLLKKVDPGFNAQAFKRSLNKKVKTLEYKDRIKCFAQHFESYLSGDYPQKIAVLISCLPEEYPHEEGMFVHNYWVNPIGDFITLYGQEDYRLSIKAIAALTKRNTGEFAIRPFIEKHPERTLKTIHKWAKSKNFHLRRLASEGIRPRLPWATKMSTFLDEPQIIVDVLELLKNDSSKYVQRSVANNLNDLIKEDEAFALGIIKRWAKKASPQTAWIIKHAIRNYRKKKDPKEKEIMSWLTT